MGINFKMSNMKARINNTVDKDPSKIHLNPGRDWLFILALFFVLIIGVSIYSYDIFIGIYKGEVYKSDDSLDVQQIKYDRFQRELETTVEFYQQKEAMFNLLVEEPPTAYPDPSTIIGN